MKHYFLKGLCLFILTGLLGCKAKKQVTQGTGPAPAVKPSASFSLEDSLHAYQFEFNTASLKAKAEFKDQDDKEIEVTITLRAVHDSAIWISVSPALGIEAARILLTTDSIKIMDKINRHYAVVPYSFLQRFTKAEVDFKSLQNIFFGNVAFIGDSLYADSIKDTYYAHTSKPALMETLSISSLFRVIDQVITEKATKDQVGVSYSAFTLHEGRSLPYKLEIHALSGIKNASLKLEYSNVSLNNPVEIRFTIPSGYSKMDY